MAQALAPEPTDAATPWQRALARHGERLALLAIALLALALRLWRLDQNGFGTEYYTAGVRSMLDDAHNFLFNAFDPAGVVSLDKPPVAFWIQVASAKLFGFSGASILIPQALEGLAAVLLLHRLVRRRFGAPAGLLAALFLALTPLSVAVDRSSNTDSCLVLCLLVASAALLAAAERGSVVRLALALAIIGVGFNVKMLAALVVVPSFAVVYLVAAPLDLTRRLIHLGIGGLVLGAVALSWIAVFDLTPPEQRPFAGSTQGNSMLELAVVEYGLDRVVGRPGRLGTDEPGLARATGNPRFARSAGLMGGSRVPAGPLRLLAPSLAAQIGWWLPLIVIGTAVAGAAARWRRPLAPAPAMLVLWSGWALTWGAVLSSIGGVFHTYYLVALAPPLAALAGIGLAALWARFRAGAPSWWLLPAALLLTAAWQTVIEAGSVGWQFEPAQGLAATLLQLVVDHAGDWRTLLYGALIVGTLAAVRGLVAARRASDATPRTSGATALALGLTTLLATPAAWSLSSVLARGDVWFPAADLALIAPGATAAAAPRERGLERPGDLAALIGFLLANRAGERYLLATLTAPQAAPVIVRTGQPVLALGGYSGNDPIVAPDALAQLVERSALRFVLIRGERAGRRNLDAATHRRSLIAWVREHGRPVDPARWRAAPDEDERTRGEAELFDLRSASAGLARTSAP